MSQDKQKEEEIIMASITVLVYPVSDIDKATTFYTKFLGVEPYAKSPYYVGFRVGDQEIGLDPNSKIGPIAYTDVEDIKASLAEMTSMGAEVVQDITDVANGLLIAQVKDTNGNVVGFRQQP
jgi:predicted enzyme related to lactoylglutathione lyase